MLSQLRTHVAHAFASALYEPFNDIDDAVPPRLQPVIDRAVEVGVHIWRRMVHATAEFKELRTEERNGTNVTVVKTALQLIGNDYGRVRPPGAWPLTSTARDKLSRLVQESAS